VGDSAGDFAGGYKNTGSPLGIRWTRKVAYGVETDCTVVAGKGKDIVRRDESHTEGNVHMAGEDKDTFGAQEVLVRIPFVK